MNQKQFADFYRKIEVMEFGRLGYIYYYGDGLSLCAGNLRELSQGSLGEIIGYIKPHHITATIVITKVRFWKGKQDGFNRELFQAGCHMDKATMENLYMANEFILAQSGKWQKNWENQPIFKAAKSFKKNGGDFRDLIRMLGF